MARYDRDARSRIWYGGGGVDEGDSDVEYGYRARGFRRGDYQGRSEAGGRSRGPAYDAGLSNWQDRSRFVGGGRASYDFGYQRGLTGMESNRYRGVYDSGFRARERDWDDSHGGYRGRGGNRGGGMNPGRGRR